MRTSTLVLATTIALGGAGTARADIFLPLCFWPGDDGTCIQTVKFDANHHYTGADSVDAKGVRRTLNIYTALEHHVDPNSKNDYLDTVATLEYLENGQRLLDVVLKYGCADDVWTVQVRDSQLDWRSVFSYYSDANTSPSATIEMTPLANGVKGRTYDFSESCDLVAGTCDGVGLQFDAYVVPLMDRLGYFSSVIASAANDFNALDAARVAAHQLPPHYAANVSYIGSLRTMLGWSVYEDVPRFSGDTPRGKQVLQWLGGWTALLWEANAPVFKIPSAPPPNIGHFPKDDTEDDSPGES